MKVKAFYPVTLIVDGEEIFLRIKRMNFEEKDDYSNKFDKLSEPTINRFVSRASSGPEQEQNSKGAYVVPFDKLAEKRLEGMDIETRTKFDAAVKLDMGHMQEFFEESFERYVTVERGLIEELADGSEKSVTEGLDFFRIYGARIDVLLQVLEKLLVENTMSAEQKKTWKSPIASLPSSTGRRRAQAGRKRGTTAKPAATEDSAGNGDATAKERMLSRGGLSGLTETSLSNPAPSSD